ncbi:N-acetylmuramoyl-L-alanine amidase [Acidovorax sp. GBBC 1281]|uniref:N-acetylmuramoyl-L-alanine amidase n=1 Tax=Acidovorax sp. GBBC 1281 TaxID=2940492 RepID=UPI00234A1265|nr:N-acetylmuramoyl-L-alanine amidase [Acidovorax sp. GBBC 1281]
MLLIEKTGRIVHPKIKPAISHAIERGSMHVINGIVIHQTASPTAKATLNAYTAPDANGAHLLIDKDGSIYQTASIYQKTHHVGHIQSRCLAEHQCSPKDIKDLQGKRVGAQIGRVEVRKEAFPSALPLQRGLHRHRNSLDGTGRRIRSGDSATAGLIVVAALRVGPSSGNIHERSLQAFGNFVEIGNRRE